MKKGNTTYVGGSTYRDGEQWIVYAGGAVYRGTKQVAHIRHVCTPGVSGDGARLLCLPVPRVGRLEFDSCGVDLRHLWHKTDALVEAIKKHIGG